MPVGGLASMPLTEPTPRSTIRVYLGVLAAGAPSSSFIEIRHRAREQVFASEFFPVDDIRGATDSILARCRRTDVYVGCLPRARAAGTKDAIAEGHMLWAECDGADAARAALRWRPAPAMVVASGSGENVHAYWPLARALAPRELETANLRLARALGADVGCFDVGRILRPPSTWNHKRQPPSPVRLVRLEPRRFEPEQVLAAAPALDLAAVERRWDPRPTRAVGDDPLLRIPPSVYVETLLGRRVGRNRKVTCPFHEDAHPSLHVYAAPERGWTCFSCRRGGSIYDLAAALWGMGTRGGEFVELRRRLNRTFGQSLHAVHERER